MILNSAVVCYLGKFNINTLRLLSCLVSVSHTYTVCVGDKSLSRCYLSLRFPLELLPVDPARVRLLLESPESFRVRVPTCSLELALLTVLRWEGEVDREKRAGQEIGHKSTWRSFSKNVLWLKFSSKKQLLKAHIYLMIQLGSLLNIT